MWHPFIIEPVMQQLKRRQERLATLEAKPAVPQTKTLYSIVWHCFHPSRVLLNSTRTRVMWVWATSPQITPTLQHCSTAAPPPVPVLSLSPQVPFLPLCCSHGIGMEGLPWACEQPCRNSISPVIAAQDCTQSSSTTSGFPTLTSHLPHIRRKCLSFVFSCAQRDGLNVQGSGSLRKALAGLSTHTELCRSDELSLPASSFSRQHSQASCFIRHRLSLRLWSNSSEVEKSLSIYWTNSKLWWESLHREKAEKNWIKAVLKQESTCLQASIVDTSSVLSQQLR